MTFDAYHRRGEVILRSRVWDGIDRPEYNDIGKMHWKLAKGLGEELLAAAEEARQHLHGEAVKKLEELRTKREQLDLEIERLSNTCE